MTVETVEAPVIYDGLMAQDQKGFSSSTVDSGKAFDGFMAWSFFVYDVGMVHAPPPPFLFFFFFFFFGKHSAMGIIEVFKKSWLHLSQTAMIQWQLEGPPDMNHIIKCSIGVIGRKKWARPPVPTELIISPMQPLAQFSRNRRPVHSSTTVVWMEKWMQELLRIFFHLFPSILKMYLCIFFQASVFLYIHFSEFYSIFKNTNFHPHFWNIITASYLNWFVFFIYIFYRQFVFLFALFVWALFIVITNCQHKINPFILNVIVSELQRCHQCEADHFRMFYSYYWQYVQQRVCKSPVPSPVECFL